tara:strand:+ start:190388 stop:194125 length:3738 start_codon:yes stop_codon:yes gene_type:complete
MKKLLSFAFSSVLWACASAQAQSPAAPPMPPMPPDPSIDHTLVDDMWVPNHVLETDSLWDGAPWPGGVVPYAFDANTVSPSQQVMTRRAMAEIEGVCGVTFVPWTSGPNYLFIRENPNSTTVSNSSVGMQPVPQFLNIAEEHWNARFVIVHELMHALGFMHEHQRADRNLYVTINWNAIDPFCVGGCTGNFALSNSQMVGGYDFESVMHYQQDAFGFGGATTIQCKPGFTQYQTEMGHYSYLSAGDAQALQTKYGTPTTASISTHAPTNIVTGSGDVTVIFASSGLLGGSLEANHGVQGSRVQYLNNGTWTDAETVAITSSLIFGRVAVGPDFPTGPLRFRIWNDVYAGGPSAYVTSIVSAPPCVSAGERAGSAIASMQDINADGHEEIVVGIPGYLSGVGRVTCRSGADGQVLWQYTGAVANANVGTALAKIGDIDGDGTDDVASGAPGSGNGTVHILSGQTGLVLRTINASTLGSGPGFGTAVSAAGDLNLDGVPDLVVGSPFFNSNRGRIDLISGQSGGVFFAIPGFQAGERFGSSVCGGFDFNNDGRPEVAGGAPYFSGSNGTYCGRIAIYQGAFGTLLANANGDGDRDLLGYSIAMAPSTDGKDYGCLAAGAPELAFPGQPAGTGYVRLYRYLTGQITGLLPLATWQSYSAGSKYGYRLEAAGDIDDDGGTDFLIAAPGSATAEAVVELRSGRTSQVLWQADDPASGDLFGGGLAVANLIGGATSSAIIGAPLADGQCVDSGEWHCRKMQVRPEANKLMITEVAAAGGGTTVAAIELTNCSASAIDLSDWQVRLRDQFGGGSNGHASSLAGVVIRPRESIVLRTLLGSDPSETPPSVQVLPVLTGGPSGVSDFLASLIAPNGYVIDEVRSENPNGTYNEGSYGGKFEGSVHNHQSGTFVTQRRIERIWGLDSNTASDWMASGARSLGLESGSFGSRDLRSSYLGSSRVKINEVSRGSATYIELVNRGNVTVDLRGYVLRYSSAQSASIEELLPFPTWQALGAGKYLIVGSTAQPPAERPSLVPYKRINGLALGAEEFTVGLYDASGRLLDLVCASRANSTLVHNDPRLPSHAGDFVGVARAGSVNQSIGRNTEGKDTNTGDDWRSFAVRTMGSPNLIPQWSPNPQKGLDVRVSRRPGVSLSIILDAGPERGGHRWSFAASVGHLYGQGPVFGLGLDAINNWIVLANTPPFTGVLDAKGNARLDLDGSLLPPGLPLDMLFVLQNPTTGQIVLLTPVVMYDS